MPIGTDRVRPNQTEIFSGKSSAQGFPRNGHNEIISPAFRFLGKLPCLLKSPE